MGLVPTYAVALGLFLRSGTVGLRWMGHFAVCYAATIGIGALFWYQAVANRPGAWSILPMSALAMLGVLLAWARARLASRADSDAVAAALLASGGWRGGGGYQRLH